MRPVQQTDFLTGVKDCVPTLMGYLCIGFAAGVIEKTAGLSIAEIALMSLLLYAGSAQFIFAGMYAAGSPLLSVVFTIFFVNIRHLLMSAALSPYFRQTTAWRNMLLGSQLTDETFGVAVTRLAEGRPRNREQWMLGLNMTAHVNWIAANIAGACFGAWIPDPQSYGLDYALPAMFIGLLVLQMTSRKKLRLDLTVAASAVLLLVWLHLLGLGSAAVIMAAVGAACVGMVLEAWK